MRTFESACYFLRHRGDCITLPVLWSISYIVVHMFGVTMDTIQDVTAKNKRIDKQPQL
jgi:hypothetical protein